MSDEPKSLDTSYNQPCCWLCGDVGATHISHGISPKELSPAHFVIIDAHYGTTLVRKSV